MEESMESDDLDISTRLERDDREVCMEDRNAADCDEMSPDSWLCWNGVEDPIMEESECGHSMDLDPLGRQADREFTYGFIDGETRPLNMDMDDRSGAGGLCRAASAACRRNRILSSLPDPPPPPPPKKLLSIFDPSSFLHRVPSVLLSML